jgi:hypothetical protein
MLKQSSSRTKQVLTILLVALFAVSVTASADRGGHGEHGDWGCGATIRIIIGGMASTIPNCDWV